MTKDDISPLMRNLLTAEQARLLDDDVGRAVSLSIKYGSAKRFEHQHLAKVLRDHNLELARCPFFKPRGLNYGDLNLGREPQTKQEILIPHASLAGCPIFIGGATGSGKSNLAKHLLSEISKCSCSEGIWAIDCRKSEMVSLFESFRQSGSEASIVDTQDIKLNLFEVPDHVLPQSFIASASDTLVRSLGLGPGAKKVPYQILSYLFERNGIFSGNTSNYPVIFEFYDALYDSSHFHSQARDAILTALAPHLLLLRKSLCFRKGWNIRAIGKQKIIWQLSTCSDGARNLLVNTLLDSTFQSRVAEGFSNVDHSLLMIYLDEASNLLESDDAAISSWIGLTRGVGIWLMLSNQQTLSVSNKILANIPTIFQGQASFAELNSVGSSIGLDAHQKQFAVNYLRPGVFIGRIASGTWRFPFLFSPPLMKSATLSEQQNSRHISTELASLPVIAEPKFENWQPAWMRKEIITSVPDLQLPSQTLSNVLDTCIDTPKQSCGGLDTDELRLLEAIAAVPCQPVSFYTTKVRMSKQTIIRLRKSLVSKNIIIERKIQAGRGRPQIQLEPSPSGVALLEKSASQGGS